MSSCRERYRSRAREDHTELRSTRSSCDVRVLIILGPQKIRSLSATTAGFSTHLCSQRHDSQRAKGAVDQTVVSRGTGFRTGHMGARPWQRCQGCVSTRRPRERAESWRRKHSRTGLEVLRGSTPMAIDVVGPSAVDVDGHDRGQMSAPVTLTPSTSPTIRFAEDSGVPLTSRGLWPPKTPSGSFPVPLAHSEMSPDIGSTPDPWSGVLFRVRTRRRPRDRRRLLLARAALPLRAVFVIRCAVRPDSARFTAAGRVPTTGSATVSAGSHPIPGRR